VTSSWEVAVIKAEVTPGGDNVALAGDRVDH
jgi:hypothetical protein